MNYLLELSKKRIEVYKNTPIFIVGDMHFAKQAYANRANVYATINRATLNNFDESKILKSNYDWIKEGF